MNEALAVAAGVLVIIAVLIGVAVVIGRCIGRQEQDLPGHYDPYTDEAPLRDASRGDMPW